MIQFEIKGIKFQVEKLPPMEGFQQVEEIRRQLAITANEFTTGGGDVDNTALFFKTILGLPEPFVKKLMDKLFNYVKFSGNGVERGHLKLLGAEDTAFKDFEVSDIYEVLGRCLSINFLGSFSAIKSKLDQIGIRLSPQRKQGT